MFANYYTAVKRNTLGSDLTAFKKPIQFKAATSLLSPLH